MCGCNSNIGQSCYQCAQTVQLSSCDGCQHTLNTDCVIFNQERLSFEPQSVKDNSARTLTTILRNIEDTNLDKESKIITDAYTILASDVDKILLLKATFDDVSGGELSIPLTLPIDIAFANKILTFKNISGVGVGGRTAGWNFDIAIQYQWSPSVLTATAYNTLDDANKCLRLTFVKVDSVNYQWLVI